MAGVGLHYILGRGLMLFWEMCVCLMLCGSVCVSVGGLTCVRRSLRVEWTAGLLQGRRHPPSLSHAGSRWSEGERSPGKRW